MGDDTRDQTNDIITNIEDMLADDTTPSVDGKVRLNVVNEGVFLIVTAPEGRGAPVDWVRVQGLLDSKGIVESDLQKIRQAIDEQTGEPVLIAPRKPELDQDAQAEVTIEDEGMSAYLQVTPALGGKALNRELIENAIAEKGIKEGLLPDIVTKAMAVKEGRFLVAKGTPPIPGVDAEISFKFNIDPNSAPVELEDGSVDFRNLDLIQNVKAGDALAERIPPVPGMPGKNVIGQAIKPEGGKNIRLPKGTNTVVAEDNENLLVAKSDGQAVYKDGKVHVFPVCTIGKDVDLETGNIDFVGSVMVYGGVRSGFMVHAAGNIEIKGPVEAATIIADGDVVLQRGMQGGDTGQIIAGKSVSAKFLEHCKVKAKEDIIVSDAIMYCQLEAGKSIRTVGKQGRLVGGIALAGETIEARVMGSKLGMKTEAEVGVNPEIRRELVALNEEYAQKERQYKMVAAGITRVKKELQAGKTLSPAENERVTKLIETHKVLKDQIAAMEQKKAEYEEIIAHSKKGRIIVHERVYPGVKVTIGKEHLIVADEIENVLYYLHGNELSQGSAD